MKATRKLAKLLCEYLFEQEFKELKYATPEQVLVLRKALEILNILVKKGK